MVSPARAESVKNKRSSLVYALRKEHLLNTGDDGRGGAEEKKTKNKRDASRNLENNDADQEKKIYDEYRLN